MSPLGSRPRPRVSSTTTRSRRGFVTGDERISLARSPTLASELATIGRVGTVRPLAPGLVGILARSTQLGLSWSIEGAPARVRGTLTGAPLLGRRPTPGLLAPLRLAARAGRALAAVGAGLALRSSGPASWEWGGRRWLARWAGRSPPAEGDPPAGVLMAPRRFVEGGHLSSVGPPP